MRAVIQAVSSASVRVNGGEPRPIGPGLVILLGVKDTDTLDIVPKLAEKCAGLRIFKDENDKLNLSAKDLGYSALVVSQFTLYGDTKKGFRPSFIKAARPPLAVDAYELFLAEMNKKGLKDVFKIIEKTDIPVKTFRPTHAKNNLKDMMKLAKMGGYVDFTASPPSGCAAIMKEFMAEAPDGSVTMSSDSNGSMPVWNEKNELIGIKAAESTGVYETMVALHLEQGLPLEEALKPCTVNVAKALNLYPRKGCLKPDSDADILVLDGDELKLYEMYAKGKKMMAEGKPIVKGYFEK